MKWIGNLPFIWQGSITFIITLLVLFALAISLVWIIIKGLNAVSLAIIEGKYKRLAARKKLQVEFGEPGPSPVEQGVAAIRYAFKKGDKLEQQAIRAFRRGLRARDDAKAKALFAESAAKFDQDITAALVGKATDAAIAKLRRKGALFAPIDTHIAKAAYEKLLALSPDDIDANSRLGHLLMRL